MDVILSLSLEANVNLSEKYKYVGKGWIVKDGTVEIQWDTDVACGQATSVTNKGKF